MKAFWQVPAMAVLALAARGVALPVMETQQGPVTVAVVSFALQGADVDSLHFTVQSHVVSTRTLRVKHVQFEQMRLGSVPVYLGPLEDQLTLSAGVPVDLPDLPLTIYLRDLNSLAPVQQIVGDGEAKVEGTARVDLELNLLERFASGQWNPHAEMPIRVTVPVHTPGGFVGRAAALATLEAAQLALDLGGAVLKPLRSSRQRLDALLATYTPTMVVAEAHYSLMRKEQRVDVVVRGLGLRVSGDQFVVTSEMIEPWKYDIDVATALGTGEVSLLEGSRDLLIAPVGALLDASTAASIAHGSVAVVHVSSQPESTEVAAGAGHVKVKLYRRNSDRNYAVLRMKRPGDLGVAVAPLADQQQPWSRLAMFRVDGQGRLQAISLPAHRDGSRIALDEPVDSAAFGSILIADDGAMGMVQDERSGMLLRTKW